MPLTVKKWNAGGDAPVEGDSEVAAYLPYNGQASGDRLIPFELADQHDILYGRATVTRDIPTADIEMKHAMSLVRIKILKNEYMGEGIVSNIRFDNVITRMTLDIRRETNSPLIFDFSSRGEPASWRKLSSERCRSGGSGDNSSPLSTVMTRKRQSVLPLTEKNIPMSSTGTMNGRRE